MIFSSFALFHFIIEDPFNGHNQTTFEQLKAFVSLCFNLVPAFKAPFLPFPFLCRGALCAWTCNLFALLFILYPQPPPKSTVELMALESELSLIGAHGPPHTYTERLKDCQSGG